MNSEFLSMLLFGMLAVAMCEECDMKKADAFMQCLESKTEEDMKKWTPDMIKEKHDAIDKCFASNGCDKPDYERDVFSDLPPNFQVMAKKMKSDWDETPAEVKKCIVGDMKNVIKEKMNKCLKSQNVPEINDLPDSLVKKVSEFILGDNENKEKKAFIEKIFTIKTNVARAFRICKESKGEDSQKKVWDCFNDIRQKYMFGPMCTNKQTCEKDKLDEVCVKRENELGDACCKCAMDKYKKVEAKIDEMRKNPDADVDAVVEMFCEEENATKMVDKMKECYDKNKAPLPTSAKLLEAMRKAKSLPAGGPKFQFNKGTIDTIHDVIVGMIEDDKCFICKGGNTTDKPK